MPSVWPGHTALRLLARGIAALVVALAVAIGASPALARDFPDVTTHDWFYASVQWADSNGVMTGYSDGHFGPSDGLTREQEATVLWRCLGNGERAQATTLGDVDQAAYYATPVNWAVSSGTMTGYSGTGTFGVGCPLTRQERRGGVYRWYEPTQLSDLDMTLDADVAADVSRAERALFGDIASTSVNMEGGLLGCCFDLRLWHPLA